MEPNEYEAIIIARSDMAVGFKKPARLGIWEMDANGVKGCFCLMIPAM